MRTPFESKNWSCAATRSSAKKSNAKITNSTNVSRTDLVIIPPFSCMFVDTYTATQSYGPWYRCEHGAPVEGIAFSERLRRLPCRRYQHCRTLKLTCCRKRE